MRHLLKLALVALILSSWGCANLMPGSSSDPAPSPEPAIASSFYYDFSDIRVPAEMELQKDKSSITPTNQGKIGVMKFKGRVEPISLFDFFSNTMPKDGWTMLTYQKYQRFLMVFTKDNRVTVVTIAEDPIYYTNLEVWVSYRVPGGSAPAYSTGAQPVDTYPSSGSSSGSGSSIESERTLSQ